MVSDVLAQWVSTSSGINPAQYVLDLLLPVLIAAGGCRVLAALLNPAK